MFSALSSLNKFRNKLVFIQYLFIIGLIIFFVVASSSNIHAATIFSDDFNDNSIDTSKWSEIEYLTQNNITEENGYILLNGSGVGWGRTAFIDRKSVV